ncbi:hypothetical protein G6F57_012742 [Rhizopus arrhizus]|uniref:Reverse transcriptase domain-containing protein n=1 Tax=Rhizopus oryzae TaxID=64495 RepID=A0A9P7BLZ5_RHIOR|nr:hypothetical protein G6F23_010209 [Rhizopus arrhizus]KAG1401687.1 hypothetical protein G6F58_010700 [Rhizopus delemar]KAG0754921.1 hypothetical protein G6F24_012164 [Rhizopus arrhizus]KAG0780985.1 hypothetical protein G6F21_011882 [Rhizopus arrhizus]KAG0782320.1 hypothetical protein G6F22_009159 [Rhizopus arrhizus]
MLMNDLANIPIFQRYQSNATISSVIDYIYVGTTIHHNLKDTQLTRLHQSWSDHSILQVSFMAGQAPTGPGLWRANPVYASHSALKDQITHKINRLIQNLSKDTQSTPADKWDKVKSTTKKVIRNYGYSYIDWRKTTVRQLERKRNRILRGQPPLAIRAQLIEPIDRMLGKLQQELAIIDGLKAGIRWREQGEKSAGFFKRLHQQRTVQQRMTSVKVMDQHLSTNNVEAVPPTDHTSDPTAMRKIVREYYQRLYTTDHVQDIEIDNYLNTIHFSRSVDQRENDALVSNITMDELLEQVQRSSKQSSPGNDGLGYQYLHILFAIPSLKKLILEVYNNALTKEETPSSWKGIRVRLLPKKGDVSDLKNWRPTSLINCDAKIFTRVTNLQLSNIVNKIINPSQTGFMRRRFIGDNGLLLHLIVQQARRSKHTGICLLLDQEKAYDRVNPQYLVRVLTAFGFHKSFIRCINHLFFGNMVQINVNGYFTPIIDQQRGLRQGDPLSPILFNLALEPLLLAINQDNDMIGYRYVTTGIEHRVKILAYADDICIMVDSVPDYNRLHHHLNWYSMVSNAKFNEEKTEAFALSGYPNETWKAYLLQQKISVYYTDRPSEPFRYLGYRIMFTTAQRSFLQDQLIAKVKDQVHIYSQRQISLRGRATIMNTLILTKICIHGR